MAEPFEQLSRELALADRVSTSIRNRVVVGEYEPDGTGNRAFDYGHAMFMKCE